MSSNVVARFFYANILPVLCANPDFFFVKCCNNMICELNFVMGDVSIFVY